MEHPEKIYHLFISCPKIKKFWRELRVWLQTNANVDISLEERKKLFSYTGKDKLKNFIYVLAKYYIYQNKFISRNLCLQGFINLLKKKMLSEKYIAFINNKLGNFFKKWSPVYNYFSHSDSLEQFFIVPEMFLFLMIILCTTTCSQEFSTCINKSFYNLVYM